VYDILLFDNLWGTNFRMWYDEDGSFRFGLHFGPAEALLIALRKAPAPQRASTRTSECPYFGDPDEGVK
jgi:hypothetical protein